MLVLQRSNGMDSFDPSAAQDLLSFMEPPEPAPGQPLLSDNDNKLLGNFFESMEDNFTFEGLNFSEDWLNLPPQFMGHTTSFGQQPSPALESPAHGLAAQFPDIMASSSLMPPPPPPTQSHPPIEQQQASADVLAAATLLQNGSMSRPSTNGHDAMYAGRNVQSSLGPPVGHLRHQPINEFRQEGRRISQSHALDDHDNTFTEMMFGSAPRPAPVPRHPPVEVQWGSDSSFGRQTFVPQSAKETSEALINQHLSYMECLEVSNSAANSRPTSPIHNGEGSPLKLKTRNPTIKQEDDANAPPRKRRKSKARDDEDDDDDEPQSATTSGSKAAARKRKSKADAAIAGSPTSNDPRRRKSVLNVSSSKAARENLSEEQKRENHIRSEQKRRTVIKEGFDDLCDLVPGLKGGGFSKSTMLAMAAEWLEEMLQGNQVLEKQLSALEGQ
ncbi:hypothetical protein GQ53DRAFT_313724 [Thozetella sp. PMI_491]|nr:hypothetical protein GQ53DRAFT_313724 [Thozetella sp. PMI_491]